MLLVTKLVAGHLFCSRPVGTPLFLKSDNDVILQFLLGLVSDRLQNFVTARIVCYLFCLSELHVQPIIAF